MAVTRYLVLEHNGQWKINLNNQYYGPFPTREEAVVNATQGARAAVNQGLDAQVLVAAPAGFDVVWTKEQDRKATPPNA